MDYAVLDEKRKLELRFVILRYEGKIPWMAGCTECQRKFFTPNSFAGDQAAAAQYLLDKFVHHKC